MKSATQLTGAILQEGVKLVCLLSIRKGFTLDVEIFSINFASYVKLKKVPPLRIEGGFRF
ncbi:hypothetical protein GCM10011384_43740 [Psychrobacillus lasiicapitis]|nr:hypothetical protein GCM10011384_43740 [Psychrobacillus lasiicapitis]